MFLLSTWHNTTLLCWLVEASIAYTAGAGHSSVFCGNKSTGAVTVVWITDVIAVRYSNYNVLGLINRLEHYIPRNKITDIFVRFTWRFCLPYCNESSYGTSVQPVRVALQVCCHAALLSVVMWIITALNCQLLECLRNQRHFIFGWWHHTFVQS